MFCGLLQAEGITAFVAHEHHIGNNWPLSTALGWTKVQVLPEELGRPGLLKGWFGVVNFAHCCRPNSVTLTIPAARFAAKLTTAAAVLSCLP